MALLLMGMMLIAGAAVCAYVAVSGVPAGRLSKERLAGYSVVEHRSGLTRVADAIVGHVESAMSRRGWRPFTALELELAGVRTPVASLVVLISCISLAMFAMLLVVFGSIWAGLLGALVAPLLTKTVLRQLAGRRRKKFAGQLPQMLQMTAASLRAGHSLTRSLDAVARESDSPMSEELARVVNEYRLGRDLVGAMEQVSERMKSQDFFWVAGAISAQRESGGNLNEILDQVSETIRERNQIRMQVKALSAEGRISAYILMALPVGIGIYYSLVSAETMGLFVDSAIGKVLLAGSAVMYVLGGFWMRSIVNIEF